MPLTGITFYNSTKIIVIFSTQTGVPVQRKIIAIFVEVTVLTGQVPYRLNKHCLLYPINVSEYVKLFKEQF